MLGNFMLLNLFLAIILKNVEEKYTRSISGKNSKGGLHKNFKPSNILEDKSDEPNQ